MGAEIIIYTGNKEKVTKRSIRKRRKKETKYKEAVTYPMQEDGEKGIKSGKSYSTCRLI